MTFKELVQGDIEKVFLNPSEFGEEHVVNGKKMLVVIDSCELMERKKRIQSHMDGAYTKQMLLYVAASDFGSLPTRDSKITLDGTLYTVADAASEAGVYSITIEANKGRGR